MLSDFSSLSSSFRLSRIVGCSAASSAQIARSQLHTAYISGPFVVLSDVRKPSCEQTILSFSANLVAVDLADNGRLVAVADKAGLVYVSETSQPQILLSELRVHQPAQWLHLIGSSLLLIVAGDTVTCFDWRAKRKLAAVNVGKRILAVAANDASVFVTGARGFARLLILNKVRSGLIVAKVLQPFTAETLVDCIQSDRDSDVLVTVSSQGTLFFLSKTSLALVKAVVIGKGDTPTSVDINDHIVVVGLSSGACKIFDIHSRAEIASLQTGPGPVLAVRLLPGEEQNCLCLYGDSSLILWRHPSPVCQFVVGRQGRLVDGCGLKERGTHDSFYVVLSEDALSFLDAATGEAVRSILLADLNPGVQAQRVFDLGDKQTAIWWSDQSVTAVSGSDGTVTVSLIEAVAVDVVDSLVAVAEQSGRVTLLDRNFKIISSFVGDTQFVPDKIQLVLQESASPRAVLWAAESGRLKCLAFGEGEGELPFVEAETAGIALVTWCADNDGLVCVDKAGGLFRVILPSLEVIFLMNTGYAHVTHIVKVTDTVFVCASNDCVFAVDLEQRSVLKGEYSLRNTNTEIARMFILHACDLHVLLKTGQVLVLSLAFSQLPSRSHVLRDVSNVDERDRRRFSIARQPRWSVTPDDAQIILSPRPPVGKSKWHRVSKVGGEIREIPTSSALSHTSDEDVTNLLELVAEAERSMDGIRRLHPGFSLDHCSVEEAQALESLRLKTTEFADWLQSHLYCKHPKLHRNI